MRATKAKALRKAFGTDVQYDTIKHKAKPVQTGFNADGTPSYVMMTPVTLVLADCGRKYCQEAKKVM